MIRFEDIYETVAQPPPRRRPRAAAQGLHLLRGRAQGPDARLRRALPRAPARGGGHPGRDADGPGLRGGRPPARRAGGHPHRSRPHPRVLRRGRAPHRGGRDQDQQDPVLLLRGAAGGELPQAAAGHGGRHPRHPGQAGRPPAQHAHAAVPARGAPRAHRARDHGHLRAPGRPAGHEQDQERAGGPLLPVPGARGLQDAARARGGAARAGHRVHREDQGARWPSKLQAAGLEATLEGRIKRLYSIHQKLRASASTSTRSTTSWPCASWWPASPTATPCWASCTTCGGRCRAASRTSSPCRGPTATSRCTPR